MRYLLAFLLFGVAHAGTLTLSGSTCAGSVDTTTGAFTLNCGPSVAPPPPPSTTPTSFVGLPAIVTALPWVSGPYVYSAGFNTMSSVWALKFTPQPMSRIGMLRCAEDGGSPVRRMAYLFNSAGTQLASYGPTTSPTLYLDTTPTPYTATVTAGAAYYAVIQNLSLPDSPTVCSLSL